MPSIEDSIVGLVTSIDMMQVENWFNFDTNPLYALMHESIYCQVFIYSYVSILQFSMTDPQGHSLNQMIIFAAYFCKISVNLCTN